MFKIPKVAPVYDKDSRLDHGNYRPISLLWKMEIIIKKLKYQRLYRFLNDNNVLFELPFGFSQRFCTKHALSNINEKEHEITSCCKPHQMFVVKSIFQIYRQAFNTFTETFVPNLLFLTHPSLQILGKTKIEVFPISSFLVSPL